MMRAKIELANILLIVVLAAPVLYANSDRPGRQGDVADPQHRVQTVERTARHDELRERRDERKAIKAENAAGRTAGQDFAGRFSLFLYQP